MDRPNVLFLMTDQQRWDALGCVGGWVHTPNLDRIAAQGVRFANCMTNSPVCIPARLSLATGRYPHNTGVWRNMAHDMPADTPTWMQAVREAGYHSAVFGKTHLHRHRGDLRDREHLVRAYGMDHVDEIGGPRASARVLSHMTEMWQRRGLWEAYRRDYEERFRVKPHMVRPSPLPLDAYADVYVGQQAARYLERYDREQPWFCWVSFGGPHEPWDAPEPYASTYDPHDMPPPVPRPEGVSSRPQGYLDERLASPPRLDPGDVGRMRANYAGKVTLIDEQIGEILSVIRHRGELDRTVIALTSDHGEMNGDYGLIYKETFIEGAVHVPLVLRTPGTARGPQAGQVCESPVEWMDVGPTLVELAGGTLRHRHFARSLVPALDDPSIAVRREAISELRGEIMIADTRFKMALNREGQPTLLFDRVHDPDEQRNLVADPVMRPVIDDLRARLLERLVQTQVYEP